MLAASSNGGGYANIFQQKDKVFLPTVLQELWDFDTRISSSAADFLDKQSADKILRGYNQTASHSPDADFAVTLADSRWANYYTARASGAVSAEIPPLPPGPYNDTKTTDGLHSLNCTHHLIRDFMFLDAAVNNNITLLPSVDPAWPTGDFPYQLARQGIDTSEGDVHLYTNGTKPAPDGSLHHSGTYYLLNDTGGVADDGSVLNFESRDVGFTVLLYELQDAPGSAADVVPNWFGVAVPDGITDFRNIIIYFHPNPAQSGASYAQGDYHNKSGNGTPGHTNWKELFAYVERLGKQLAGAANYRTAANDLRNQIVIFPFFRDYDDVGIFPTYWSYIVRRILDDLYLNRASFVAP